MVHNCVCDDEYSYVKSSSY